MKDEGVRPQHETRVLDNTNQVAEYTYNGAGQRIKKVTQTETRIFHYDLKGHLIAETSQTGQMLAEYVYLGDQLLSMIKPGESVYYFHNDHLGTPQVLTNDSQAVAWKAVYTPFGEAVPSIQTVENPFRFPGQYYDQETGLHYNYFRYYNPQTGRYITPDPIGLEGGINLFTYVDSVGKPFYTNLYTYTGNNPINFVDPKGLFHQGFILQLVKYSEKGLRKAIKRFEKKIIKHEKALLDPCQKLATKHHEHELRVLREELKLAQEELAKRGLPAALAAGSFAEDITEEEAERRTGGWLIDLLFGGDYAY